MYKKKKIGQITLMETHFSHTQPFSHISSFTVPERTSSPCNTRIQTKLTPAPCLGVLQGTGCCSPGPSKRVAVASRAHWVSGFVLTLVSVLQLEKPQTYPSPCWSPQGGRGRWVPSVSSSLVLKTGMGPWRGPGWSQPCCQEMTAYQSGTEPGIYSPCLDAQRSDEFALKMTLHYLSGFHH